MGGLGGVQRGVRVGGGGGAVTAQALVGGAVGGLRLARRADRAAGALFREFQAQDAQVPVPQREQVRGGGLRAPGVVDADVHGARVGFLIDQDGGESAFQDGAQQGAAVGGAVHDEAVHAGVPHGQGRVCLRVVRRREQQDVQVTVLHGAGDAAQEQRGGRVGEGVVERRVVHDAQHAGAAPAQAAGQGVGTVVAEVAGSLKHALTQVLAELVGSVVGVADGGDTDAQGAGHVPQGDAPTGAGGAGSIGGLGGRHTGMVAYSRPF